MYGKHFQSTYNGSMVGSGPVVFAVWGYVISHTRESIVELNPVILGAILGCTSDEVEKAISKLCAPDEKSRSPENDGKRLVKKTEYAYFVPTYDKYQNIRNELERREYMKNYMRDYRKNHQDDVNVNGKLSKPPLAHSYTDSDSDSDIPVVTVYKTEAIVGQKPDLGSLKVKNKEIKEESKQVLQFLNLKTGKAYREVDSNLKPIESILKSGVSLQDMKTVTMRKVRDWQADPKMEQYLRPSTLYRRSNFENYLGQTITEPSHE